MRFLDKKFIEKYKNQTPPFTELGKFVYYRTYSRWLEDKGRRENWLETCERVVNYSLSLEYKHRIKNNLPIDIQKMKKEAETLFDNMFNLRQFPSGRTMWIGGTLAAEKYPTANFNCSGLILNSFYDFLDLFYLLMVGTGVGMRILKEDAEKFETYRADHDLVPLPYVPKKKNERIELSFFEEDDTSATIYVGDSKEGFVGSLKLYFDLIIKPEYSHIKTIKINFDSVRPKGERLKTFGGTASGHESLKTMFLKIHKVLKNAGGKLKPIDILDIANIIGENVVSGGVRRTSEICLSDDEEIIKAKQNIYSYDENGNLIVNTEILHRTMSNNSIYFTSKPSREYLHEILQSIKTTGEPGFINAEAAKKRRKDFQIINPCAEVLLKNKQLCNLTTVNAKAFIKPDLTFDEENFIKAMRLSARIGLRMTLVDLELPEWDKNLKDDRLVGASITGWQDMVDICKLTREQQINILKRAKAEIRDELEKYASELKVNVPLLATTIKPEGTISQLPTVSSGLHYSHSPYYIRRVRINAHDPLCKVAEELGWNVYPEVGQDWETCTTKVIEFPVASGVSRTKYDVSAIEQLENYKMFMEHYVEHNASITVTVKEDEWDAVEQWLWDNWDIVVGITFISLDNNVYPLAPYEQITKEKYEEMKRNMKPFDETLLLKYEKVEEEHELTNDECATGACPIR